MSGKRRTASSVVLPTVPFCSLASKGPKSNSAAFNVLAAGRYYQRARMGCNAVFEPLDGIYARLVRSHKASEALFELRFR
jgi:hypothetical protein